MTQKQYLTPANDTVRNDSQQRLCVRKDFTTLFYKISTPLDEKSVCSLQYNPDFSNVNPRYFKIPDNVNQIKPTDHFPSPVKTWNSPSPPIFRTSRKLELISFS